MTRLSSILSSSREAAVLPGCLPFRVDSPKAREAVLLLHGFTGHPGELGLVAEALVGCGYAVHAPRYPGHGSRRADFLSTRAEDWLRRAIDAYLDLKADYPVVHVLGHSMGGLVATALASVLDVPRLILLAPAFKASIGGLALAPFVAPFLPVLKRNKGPGAADRDPLRLALHEEYRRDDLVAPAAQLRRLQLFARRRLPEVRSKIFIITATEDRSVPPTVGAFIEKKARLAASIDCAVIEGAGHIFPFDLGAERAQALIAEWMKTK